MAVTLPDLPFKSDALEPHISAETFEYHHGKHHKAYVDKTNDLIEGTELADKTLDNIVDAAYRDGDKGLFNQAAQAWNHAFFWQCLTPQTEGVSGPLAHDLDRSFNGVEGFKEAFAEAATGQFGSGWTWLVKRDDELEIVATDDAITPLVLGQTPLLTLDVWEHAYYLDHRNDRGAFVQAFLDHLINWDFVAANYRAHEEQPGRQTARGEPKSFLTRK